MSEVGDIVDRANDYSQRMLDASIAACSKPLEAGEAGECDRCGEESKRLIRGACAPCRDKYRLP